MIRHPVEPAILPAEGFVLAGGASSRMGREKALLPFAQKTFLSHALDRLRSLPLACPPRIAGGGQNLVRFAPLLPDLHPRQGPLGGIEAALTATSQPLNLFLAVDLPRMPSDFLEWMLRRAALTEATVTLPRILGRPQPLCAIYHRNALGVIAESLAAGRRKVMDAVGATDIDAFDMESIVACCPEMPAFSEFAWRAWFRNVNSPRDLDELSGPRLS